MTIVILAGFIITSLLSTALICKIRIDISDKTKDRLSNNKENIAKNVHLINDRELKTVKYQIIEGIIITHNKRLNLQKESELFKLVGTQGLEEDFRTKKISEKKEIRLTRYAKLVELISSLSPNQIASNTFLALASHFLMTSEKDCCGIINDLYEQISNPKYVENDLMSQDDSLIRLDISTPVPKSTSDLFGKRVEEIVKIPSSKENFTNPKYVYLLDEEHRQIYEEYNKLKSRIVRLARDIYFLQMWNLLSQRADEINLYDFAITEIGSGYCFVSSFFFKRVKENKENIARIVGLPYEKLSSMTVESLEEYIEAKIKAGEVQYKEGTQESTISKEKYPSADGPVKLSLKDNISKTN